MQPFNCTVDTLVFLIREKPWRITTHNIDSSLTENYKYPRWRRFLSFLPLFRLPGSLGTQRLNCLDSKNEISTSQNANSHEVSSIPSDKNNTGNIGHVFQRSYPPTIIGNVMSSRSTDSGVSLQGGRTENNIMTNNEDHVNQQNIVSLSNSSQQMM